MPFTLTTFDTALQAKLNSASSSLSAQDYLLLTKAVAAAIEVSEGVSLISLKGSANGVAGLDSTSQVPVNQLLNAVPSQTGNSNKILQTNGSATLWSSIASVLGSSGNSGRLLTTNGNDVSWTNTAALSTISTTGDATFGGNIIVGPVATTFHNTLTDPSATFVIESAEDSYGQVAFKNTEPTSSSDIIAYSSNGTDTAGWIDMGITGPSFDSETYGITGGNDGYIFMQAPAGTTGAGNLVIATGDNGTENKIVFAAGGYESGNTQMEITPDVNIHIEIPTPSTSATTGALTVVGGVGVQGDMNINGDVSIQGTITFGGGGTTVETSNLAVTDPAVFVGTNNQSDIVDLAFIGEYASSVSTITKTISNKALTSNIATLTTSDSHTFLAGDVVVVSDVDTTFNGTYNIIEVPTTTTFTYAKTNANVTSAVATGSAAVSARRKFAGIARDASDGIVKIFKDATTKPTSTINFSEAGLTYGTIKVGGAEIGSVTNTEIGYLSGVTSAIQTQFGTKANLASPSLTGNVTLATSSGVPLTITNTGTGNSFVVEDSASTDSSPFLIDASGNVGIGTSTPTTKLNIEGGADSTTGIMTRFTNPSSGSKSKIWFTDGLTYNWTFGTNGNAFTFSNGEYPTVSGTERLRIDTNGRIIIPAGGVLEAPIATTPTTSTSVGLALTDAGKLVECSNTSAITLTVPLNSSIAFPIGTQITVLQTNTGQVTFVGASGVTVNGTPGLKLRAQWSSATLIKRADNVWVLIGDLTA
jgi:hypothetical protein